MRIIIKDLKHWKFKRDILTIGILTLVAVILWIAIEVYQTYTQTTIAGNIKKQLEPLSPSIDTQVIDSLKNRFRPPQTFSVVQPDPSPSPPRS